MRCASAANQRRGEGRRLQKIKYHTHENVGYGDVHLPEMQMHTTSFWLTVPGARRRAAERGAR